LSFNLEIAAFRKVDGETIDAYLPDVFGYANEDVSFEDATSVNMNGRLAATECGQYVIVIDTSCRLTGLRDLFRDANTKSTSACVVRISDEPIEQVFADRERTSQSLGVSAIKEAAVLNDGGSDGEDIAVSAFAKRTGITFPLDLFDLTFRVYEMD